jgi:phosphoglycerol transferase
MIIFASAICLFGYLIVALLPDRKNFHKSNRWITVIWPLSLIISLPFAVTNALFGKNEIEPILIFLGNTKMNEMAAIGIADFTKPLLNWLAVSILILVTSLFILKQKKHFEKILLCVSIVLLSLSPIVEYTANFLFPSKAQRNFVISERMHDLVIDKKPEIQKNLVIIYMESLERSYGQIPELAEYYRPLQTLSDSGTEFTNVAESIGTNYTIAGIVSTQCGIPLLPKGLQRMTKVDENKPASVERFLPSIHCMGDQLSQDGYNMSYMNGASLDKFAKRSFLLEHGYSRLFDINAVSESEKKDRTNTWGLNDALLFEHAIKEFDTLSEMKAPFVQSLLTLSTHGPDAFLSNDCAPDQTISSQIPRAIQCTGQIVTKLVDHIRASDVSDNTIIMVMSDHLSFFNTTQAHLNSVAEDRKNLFMILGHDTAGKNPRPMLPFDIYPTILSTLGYEFKDGRANMGVAMNSPTDNLIEELGLETVNKAFKGNQKLASYLWREE